MQTASGILADYELILSDGYTIMYSKWGYVFNIAVNPVIIQTLIIEYEHTHASWSKCGPARGKQIAY